MKLLFGVKQGSNSINNRGVITPYIWGLLIGLLTMLIMMAVASAIISFKDMPDAFLTPVSLVISCISSIAGGYIGALKSKSKGLIVGAIIGLIQFIFIFSAGLINK